MREKKRFKFWLYRPLVRCWNICILICDFYLFNNMKWVYSVALIVLVFAGTTIGGPYKRFDHDHDHSSEEDSGEHYGHYDHDFHGHHGHHHHYDDDKFGHNEDQFGFGQVGEGQFGENGQGGIGSEQGQGQLGQGMGQFGQGQGQFGQGMGQFGQGQGQSGQGLSQFGQGEGQFGQNQGQFGQGQGQFGQGQSQSGQRQDQFASGLEQFGQNQGQLGQNQGQLGQNQGQFGQSQGQLGQGQGQLEQAQGPNQFPGTTRNITLRDCIRRCPVTSEFNPVCGTDNITYTNPGRLECAQSCGVDVTLLRRSSCNVPAPAPSTSFPSGSTGSVLEEIFPETILGGRPDSSSSIPMGSGGRNVDVGSSTQQSPFGLKSPGDSIKDVTFDVNTDSTKLAANSETSTEGNTYSVTEIIDDIFTNNP